MEKPLRDGSTIQVAFYGGEDQCVSKIQFQIIWKGGNIIYSIQAQSSHFGGLYLLCYA